MLSLDERVEIVLCEAWGLLPPCKADAWITHIAVQDLGSKHGSYSPDDGTLTLSSRMFWGVDEYELMTIDRDGNSPAMHEDYVSRALHTVCHELMHAIGYTTGMDRHQAWLTLSGWEETWEDRHTTGRYFERRPGWGDQGGSVWRYRKGSWFCRDYSSKSPYEDYADCGTHVALGWDRGITNLHGRAKMRYLLREAWGVDSWDRLDAARASWRHRVRG